MRPVTCLRYLAVFLLGTTACHLVGGTDGLYIDDGRGGASSTVATTDATTAETTSSGSGAATSAGGNDAGGFGMGGQPECTGSADCDDSDATTCAYPGCLDLVCRVVFAPSSTPCTEDGGRVCDGAGECVECVNLDDCPSGSAACTNQFCIAMGCSSGTQDGGETDIDCGGPCAPCGNTQGCSADTDCLSGFCSGNVCAACGGHGDCDNDRYCEPVTQVCKNRRSLFSDCENGFECNSNNCCWPGWCCL